MDLKKIKSLIDLLADSPLVELELIEGDDKVKLVKRTRRESGAVSDPARDPMHDAARARERQLRTAQQMAKPPAASASDRHGAAPGIVQAPMFGVAHLQASPDDPPFVRADDVVKAGQVLCTIEAMKVFHAIESEYDGRVADVLVKSGDEVEAGQPLFRIER